MNFTILPVTVRPTALALGLLILMSSPAYAGETCNLTGGDPTGNSTANGMNTIACGINNHGRRSGQ
jgi:hypothetical protein